MTLTNLYLGYIVPGSTVLPITAGIVHYRQIDRSLRTLTWYLIFALTLNIGGITLASFHKNNLPLLHVYTAFELVAVTLYYKYAFNRPRFNTWLNAIMIAYPVLCVINFSFFQSIYTFNTYTRPLEALIIIVLSTIYLNDVARTTKSGRWVAGGFLLYFCGSLFQFIFSNVVHNQASKLMKDIIWNTHATFVLIMYIIFFVAILNGRAKR